MKCFDARKKIGIINIVVGLYHEDSKEHSN